MCILVFRSLLDPVCAALCWAVFIQRPQGNPDGGGPDLCQAVDTTATGQNQDMSEIGKTMMGKKWEKNKRLIMD